MTSETSSSIRVPLECRSSVFFIDESGSKGSAGRHFVMAAIKTNDPDALTRGMESLRAKNNVRGEMKFRDLTKKSVPFFKSLINLLEESGSNIGAFIIDKDTFNPFDGKELWEAHAWVTAALVKGMVSRSELATLLIDGISTPTDVAYGSYVRQSVNKRFKQTRVVSAVSLDSRTCDGLQLADMVASSIAHDRKSARTGRATPKAEVSRYLARAFDLHDFGDTQSPRVRIRTAVAGPKGQELTLIGSNASM